jgi:5-methylcytosine-specific restriction enzyme subunit McrC
VRRALRFGLLHGDRRREETLHTQRGRVQMEEQLRRRLGQPVPAECVFDELTADIPENRILNAALIREARLPTTAAREARSLLPAFTDVSPLEQTTPPAPPHVTPTRLNERVLPALGLARLILTGAGLEARSGATRAPSVLFDMDRIFEDFVVVALRRALGLSAWAFPQGGGRRHLSLDREGHLPLEPDLSWWEHGRCVFVGDVKYKRTTHGDQADLYQLLAYAAAANLPGGLLIYAAGEEGSQRSHIHQIRHAGKTLHVAALDLAAGPEGMQSQIDRLARAIRRLRTEARRSAA